MQAPWLIDLHAQLCGNLSSEHGEREGEAGYPLAGGALPQEGATRAPLIDSGYGFKLMNRWKTRILYTGYSGTFQIL
jgi:hypothetical protein